MKKIIPITIIFCLVALLVPSAALANGGVVFVMPHYYDDLYVNPDDELILGYAWFACTKGLVRDFLTAVHTTWEVDGELEVESHGKDDYWVPMMPFEITGCIAGNDGQAWLTWFEYSLGSGFTPGDVFDVTMVDCFTHPVNDGYDGDIDGIPDLYPAGCETYSVTIHVLSPP